MNLINYDRVTSFLQEHDIQLIRIISIIKIEFVDYENDSAGNAVNDS